MQLRRTTKTLLFLLGISFCFWPINSAFAQTNMGTEFNIQTGPMLPDQIHGVTEILPTWGFFYKVPMAGAGLEFGLLNSHSNGLDYTSLPIRGRFDISIDHYMTALAFAGPEINYYTEANSSNPMTVVGFHAGGGLMYHVLETLWFRFDMKYSVNPGDALYFGFGFSFRSAEGGGSSGG